MSALENQYVLEGNNDGRLLKSYKPHEWFDVLLILLGRDRLLHREARQRFEQMPKEYKKETAPPNQLKEGRLTSRLNKIWQERGSALHSKFLYEPYPPLILEEGAPLPDAKTLKSLGNPPLYAPGWWPPDARKEKIALCGLLEFLDDRENEDPDLLFPPYSTAKEHNELDELRTILRRLAERRLVQLDPSRRRGKPGRRGYSLEAKKYAQKIRQKHPDKKAHAIRMECLKKFSKYDIPPDGPSFRAWLNRPTKKAHEINS